MRTLLLLALPLFVMSCDAKKEAPKPHDPMAMPEAAAGADKVKDPVCGMMIDKAKAMKHPHEGTDYFFCSDACLTKFKAEPAKYASHCSCPNSKRACKCDHCGGKDACDCAK